MRLLMLLFIAISAKAGSVQGVVLEYASGRPLSRTAVRLDPVPGSVSASLQPQVLRSGRSGAFTFPRVAAGLYFLTALRDGYLPSSSGQRLPSGHGVPLSITADSTSFVELRMLHKGALTGRVLDENGVGMSGVPVVAFRATLPLRSMGRATSDDRGVYRIAGLEPGKYWVRTGAHTLPDGTGWLPTFSPQGRQVRDARVSRVNADADSAYLDVSPESGPLFSVGGWIVCRKPGRVLVTLSSETAQLSSQTICGDSPGSYQFKGLSGGDYEIRATVDNDTASAFAEFTLASDLALNLSLSGWLASEIEVWRGSGVVTGVPITLIARPQSLSDLGDAAEIRNLRADLPPGHWEMRALVPDGLYVDSISNVRAGTRGRSSLWRSSSAFDVFIEPGRTSRIRVTVADQAGRLAGAVKAETKSAAGAPVFLWPVAESARRSLGGFLKAIADNEGRFHFDNLPPGDYRVLASFDVSEIDDELAELSRAPVVHCKAGQSAAIELQVWTAPF
jgi:hypothetical protein